MRLYNKEINTKYSNSVTHFYNHQRALHSEESYNWHEMGCIESIEYKMEI